MKFHHLARKFYDWGWDIKHEHYVAFSDYVRDMVKQKRVLIIEHDNEMVAIIFFTITDDYTKLDRYSTWALHTNNPHGHQFYIDKIVCKSFSRQLVREIQLAVEKEFPNVIMGVYQRALKDKCVKIHCGGRRELQSSVS